MVAVRRSTAEDEARRSRAAVAATDGELVRAYCAGDPRAWEELVFRYARLVAAVPRRMGLAEEDVEDVAQTVWLALIENLEALQDADRLAGWLVETARHAVYHLHWQRRREQPLAEGAPDPGPDL